MEQILAFVLGVSAVAFIWAVVVAFKTAKKVKQIEFSITGLGEWIQRNDEITNRRIDQEIDRVNQLTNNIYSTIDSRVDKLESKITTKKFLKG